MDKKPYYISTAIAYLWFSGISIKYIDYTLKFRYDIR